LLVKYSIEIEAHIINNHQTNILQEGLNHSRYISNHIVTSGVKLCSNIKLNTFKFLAAVIHNKADGHHVSIKNIKNIIISLGDINNTALNHILNISGNDTIAVINSILYCTCEDKRFLFFLYSAIFILYNAYQSIAIKASQSHNVFIDQNELELLHMFNIKDDHTDPNKTIIKINLALFLNLAIIIGDKNNDIIISQTGVKAFINSTLVALVYRSAE